MDSVRRKVFADIALKVVIHLRLAAAALRRLVGRRCRRASWRRENLLAVPNGLVHAYPDRLDLLAGLRPVEDAEALAGLGVAHLRELDGVMNDRFDEVLKILVLPPQTRERRLPDGDADAFMISGPRTVSHPTASAQPTIAPVLVR